MATHLTPEEMKVLVRQHFEEFVNHKKAEVIRRNMTPDFYDHDGPDGKAAGVEEDEQMMRRMYDLMPDLRITIENMVAEGDKVVCRKRYTDGVSRLRAVAFRGQPDCRALGDRHRTSRSRRIRQHKTEKENRRKTHRMRNERDDQMHGHSSVLRTLVCSKRT